MTVPDPLSPDCEQRKCHACSGDAFDLLKDEVTRCTCACHPKPARPHKTR
jgi:hypothetical protein